MNFKIASDCNSTLHRFDSIRIVVTINTKLCVIVREILVAKKKCLRKLVIQKVDTYQDSLKAYSKLIFKES